MIKENMSEELKSMAKILAKQKGYTKYKQIKLTELYDFLVSNDFTKDYFKNYPVDVTNINFDSYGYFEEDDNYKDFYNEFIAPRGININNDQLSINEYAHNYEDNYANLALKPRKAIYDYIVKTVGYQAIWDACRKYYRTAQPTNLLISAIVYTESSNNLHGVPTPKLPTKTEIMQFIDDIDTIDNEINNLYDLIEYLKYHADVDNTIVNDIIDYAESYVDAKAVLDAVFSDASYLSYKECMQNIKSILIDSIDIE